MRLDVAAVFTALIITSIDVFASTAIRGKYSIEREESAHKSQDSFVIPYVFASESTGINGGVGGAIRGWGQDQMIIGATAWGGDNSYGFSGAVADVLTPWSDRFYFSMKGMYAHFPLKRVYGGEKQIPTPIDQPFPGSSESTADQFIQGENQTNWLEFKMEYVLPIGDGQQTSYARYRLRRGLLVDAPDSTKWNPLTHGSTTLMLQQYNRFESFDTEDGEYEGDIHAIAIGVQYDNTDFAPNPIMGSRQFLAYHYDGNWFNGGKHWDFIEADISQYFSLGESDWASQRILAFNFWTAYSPSWEVVKNDTSKLVSNGPPYNAGANLGGWNRMRGYDAYRFHDKAGMYVGAEYRYTLKYNPVRDVSWLRFLNLDWLQLVAFAEAGEVAESYNISELTSNVKFDGGVSLRALVGGLVVRTDFAMSEEGNFLWFMYDHPF